jgi:hypothetical protein
MPASAPLGKPARPAAPRRDAAFLQRTVRGVDSGRKSGRSGAASSCRAGPASVYAPCPISHVPVAACRLVGIRSTAGQPPGVLKDRWSQGWIPTAGIQVATPDPDNNRQPEAKPANPALHGGRSLKQRRTGFFGLVGPPKAGTEEACFSLPGVRWGPPFQSKAASGCSCARDALACLQSTWRVASQRPQTPDGILSS